MDEIIRQKYNVVKSLYQVQAVSTYTLCRYARFENLILFNTIFQSSLKGKQVQKVKEPNKLKAE